MDSFSDKTHTHIGTDPNAHIEKIPTSFRQDQDHNGKVIEVGVFESADFMLGSAESDEKIIGENFLDYCSEKEEDEGDIEDRLDGDGRELLAAYRPK